MDGLQEQEPSQPDATDEVLHALVHIQTLFRTKQISHELYKEAVIQTLCGQMSLPLTSAPQQLPTPHPEPSTTLIISASDYTQMPTQLPLTSLDALIPLMPLGTTPAQAANSMPLRSTMSAHAASAVMMQRHLINSTRQPTVQLQTPLTSLIPEPSTSMVQRLSSEMRRESSDLANAAQNPNMDGHAQQMAPDAFSLLKTIVGRLQAQQSEPALEILNEQTDPQSGVIDPAQSLPSASVNANSNQQLAPGAASDMIASQQRLFDYLMNVRQFAPPPDRMPTQMNVTQSELPVPPAEMTFDERERIREYLLLQVLKSNPTLLQQTVEQAHQNAMRNATLPNQPKDMAAWKQLFYDGFHEHYRDNKDIRGRMGNFGVRSKIDRTQTFDCGTDLQGTLFYQLNVVTVTGAFNRDYEIAQIKQIYRNADGRYYAVVSWISDSKKEEKLDRKVDRRIAKAKAAIKRKKKKEFKAFCKEMEPFIPYLPKPLIFRNGTCHLPGRSDGIIRKYYDRKAGKMVHIDKNGKETYTDGPRKKRRLRPLEANSSHLVRDSKIYAVYDVDFMQPKIVLLYRPVNPHNVEKKILKSLERLMNEYETYCDRQDLKQQEKTSAYTLRIRILRLLNELDSYISSVRVPQRKVYESSDSDSETSSTVGSQGALQAAQKPDDVSKVEVVSTEDTMDVTKPEERPSDVAESTESSNLEPEQVEKQMKAQPCAEPSPEPGPHRILSYERDANADPGKINLNSSSSSGYEKAPEETDSDDSSVHGYISPPPARPLSSSSDSSSDSNEEDFTSESSSSSDDASMGDVVEFSTMFDDEQPYPLDFMRHYRDPAGRKIVVTDVIGKNGRPILHFDENNEAERAIRFLNRKRQNQSYLHTKATKFWRHASESTHPSVKRLMKWRNKPPLRFGPDSTSSSSAEAVLKRRDEFQRVATQFWSGRCLLKRTVIGEPNGNVEEEKEEGRRLQKSKSTSLGPEPSLSDSAAVAVDIAMDLDKPSEDPAESNPSASALGDAGSAFVDATESQDHPSNDTPVETDAAMQ